MANTEKDEARIQTVKEYANVPWCEDFERMISGMPYNPFVPILNNARFRARQFSMKYNTYFPEDATAESLTADREVMLQQILGKIGNGCFIEPPFSIDYGCNISIGANFYANFNTIILDCGLVTIGDRVLFGPSVSIFAATHETGVQSRRDGVELAKPVTIGDDCWIGGQTAILPGVIIGNGCTIGAGSVVTRDIPPFSIAVGSPARVIKKVSPVPDV